MSNSTLAVTSSLLSLLPTSHYTVATLPKPLVAQATSLQALSRSRASALKADEEIARTYACAHLAIEQYRSRSKPASGGRGPLDVGEKGVVVKPPCGPQIYKKLKTYLGRVLLESQTAGFEGTVTPPSKRKRQPNSASTTAKKVQVQKPLYHGSVAGPKSVPASSDSTSATPKSKPELSRPDADVAKAQFVALSDDEGIIAISTGRLEDVDARLVDESSKGVALTAGSLCHPSVDWLSDWRTADYEKWKRAFLQRMDADEKRKSGLSLQ
ncbi:MAG: hypothetical protein M1828_004585 [Chrysothrix sp. TS-e1954]|nr:MAG: hypothetical protein M1828_004585 [Chrysothrix sp. TS-e1954]